MKRKRSGREGRAQEEIRKKEEGEGTCENLKGVKFAAHKAASPPLQLL